MNYEGTISSADIKATPPGMLRGMLQFCDRKLRVFAKRKKTAHSEAEELRKLASLIRAELGIFDSAAFDANAQPA